MGNDFFAIVLRWGRKDGFPGADGSTIGGKVTTISIYGASGNALTEGSTGIRTVGITTGGVLNGKTSQIYAIKNPLAFIFNATTPYDWYTNTTNHNDALWGNGKAKSVHDPCPQKWRVPTNASSTFGDFSTTTMLLSGSGTNVANGRKYSKIAWFPMAGYRNNTSGTFGGVSYDIGCWAASVSGIYAERMYSSMNDVTPSGAKNRAFGFSVRCVQE